MYELHVCLHGNVVSTTCTCMYIAERNFTIAHTHTHSHTTTHTHVHNTEICAHDCSLVPRPSIKQRTDPRGRVWANDLHYSIAKEFHSEGEPERAPH